MPILTCVLPVLFYGTVMSNRDGRKCCWWTGESKGIWLQCCQESCGSKDFTVLKDQVGLNEWVFSVIFTSFLCGILCAVLITE